MQIPLSYAFLELEFAITGYHYGHFLNASRHATT